MAKQLFCNDVIEGCQFKAKAPTDAELLEKVKAHAAESHGVTVITPELAAQVKAAIREV